MLPGVIPRVRSFFADGFSWLASLMAAIYAAVGLLPATHPYLNSANRGRFGIHHVMAEAGRRLRFDRKHIDQVVIYFMLLTAFVLMLGQFALLIISFIFEPAFAGPSFASLFETPLPDEDIAYMLLDRVFAVPNLYGSQFDPAIIGMTPFSAGLQALFQFYSQAMLIVALFILLYYIIILVAETAQTGTPFGKRFDSVWAPIRLVTAVGLLVPINYGYNSAQYIVLYAAKFGSSFATNAWNEYNATIIAAASGACTTGGVNNPIGWCDEAMISRPKSQEVSHLIKFMVMARTCAVAYETVYRNQGVDIRPYLVKTTPTGPQHQEVDSGGSVLWQDALDFYNNGDVLVVFGHYADIPEYDKYTGKVKPFCGEVVLTTSDVTNPGARTIQAAYFDEFTYFMWWDPWIDEFAFKANSIYVPVYTQEFGGPCHPNNVISSIAGADVGSCQAVAAISVAGRSPELPSSAYMNTLSNDYQGYFDTYLDDARDDAIAALDFTVNADIAKRGWGGAGIWYNRIAEWNGSLFSAAINVPSVKSMPLIMKEVEGQRSGTDQNINAVERYCPYLANKDRAKDINLIAAERPIADLLCNVYKYLLAYDNSAVIEARASGNVFFDTLSAVFGLQGLFTLRETADIHPMAQLSGIGKSIIESAIRNLTAALAFSFMGGATEILNKHMGAAFGSLASMMVSLTTIGLSVGFMLYYVLPFLPFMYFFFAVGSWIKSIFEAMVGVPLWALAHLRIDGHGLHADTALNGYFLIFEIFVRPILTVFGLLASIAIFAAMVKTLNGIFPLVTNSLTGFDTDAPKKGPSIVGIEFKRAIIDEFFFTLIYAVIVYMIGLSSFKMIDLVPNNILRWMGHGVHTFAESNESSVQGFVSYAAFGGAAMANRATGAMVAGAKAAGNVAGVPVGMLDKMMSGGRAGATAHGTPAKPGGGNNQGMAGSKEE